MPHDTTGGLATLRLNCNRQSTFAVRNISQASVKTPQTVRVIPVSPSKKNDALNNTR